MTERKNYVNKKIGKLLILADLPDHITPNGSHKRVVRVKCDCGNIYDTRLTTVKTAKMCLNCQNKLKRQKRDQDFIGRRFGKLVVIARAKDYVSPGNTHLSQFKCKCDCGNTTIVTRTALVTGDTRSCGCLANPAGLLKDCPKLLKKYDFEKNKNIDINTLTARSSRKIWWKCPKCGRSWFATIASQNDKIPHGCPYCVDHTVLPVKGQNDLLSQYPDIVAKYWDYDKNKIKPDEVTCKSSRKVWWHCSVGHKWQAAVGNKVNGSGCPKCNIENVNSFCEQAFYFYIKQVFPDAINSDQHIGMELDIYIPSKKVAIEYDGQPWHKTKRKYKLDLKKNILCLNNNITLIRIREPKLKELPNCIIFNREDTETNLSLDKVIIETLQYLNVSSIHVDTAKDAPDILSQYAQKKYKNSLAYLYPNIAKEWDYAKNGKLTPDKVNKASRFKVWWKCPKGHEYQMSVSDRTCIYKRKDGRIRKPYKCPYCSGKRILTGFNDFQTRYPEIAKTWNYTKNGNLLPNQCMPKSKKKVWWQCPKGHEYQRSLNAQCRCNGRCPYCDGKRVLPGFNDFQTSYPDIAETWNYAKNGNLLPNQCMPKSKKKVWWQCQYGHEYQRSLNDQCRRNGRCPICYRKNRKKRSTKIRGPKD